MTHVYEQKLNGQVAERLTVNSTSGMAKLEKIDRNGQVIATETFSAGDGRVSQFVYNSEPRR